MGRYMTMLGLAWVLRDEAFTMSNTAWGHCLLLLARYSIPAHPVLTDC